MPEASPEELGADAEALDCLRRAARRLSPSCRALVGGSTFDSFAGQLHQCLRRLADGKSPIEATLEMLRLSSAEMVRSGVEPRALAARVLEPGYDLLAARDCSNYGGAPPGALDVFAADLKILGTIAAGAWNRWLELAGVVPLSLPAASGPKPERRGQQLLRELRESWNWGELVEPIAEYLQTGGDAAVYRLGSKGHPLQPIAHFADFDLDWLQGNEDRIAVIERNTKRLLAGQAANNVLIWGPRGCGKSSLIRGLITRYYDRGLRGIEINPEVCSRIPELFSAVRSEPRFYLGVLDNISMSSHDPGVHTLARTLDGCLEAKPDNLVFYATSNYKDLVDREGERVQGLGPLQMQLSEAQQSLVNQGRRPDFYDPQQQQRLDEQRALDDRFALKVFMDFPTAEAYEKIVLFYARQNGVPTSGDDELLEAFNGWRMRHNHDLVGGRTARDFAVDAAPPPDEREERT